MREIRPVHIRFEDHLREEEKCWIWVGAMNSNGGPAMMTGGRGDGSRKKINVRRWAYQFYVEPIAPGLLVWMKCLRRRSCVKPEHMATGTRSEFLLFRIKKRTFAPGNADHFPKDQVGEGHPSAKISDAAVDDILAEKGKTKALVLSRRHEISESQVYMIWCGKARARKAARPAARFASSKGLTVPGTSAQFARSLLEPKPHQGETKCSTPSSSSF